MLRTALLVAAILVAGPVIAGAQKEDPKYKITPTKTTKYGAKIYIPADLEDSFKELDKMLTKAFREEFRSKTERDLIEYHMGFGMWMRNEWGLWKGLRFAKWFNKQGIHHPDDMSAIILKSYWLRLNKKPIDLQKQIKYYQDYWKKAGEEQKVEQARVKSAQAKIKKMMMGLELRRSQAPEVEFKGSLDADGRIVYAAPFRDGVLVGVRKYDKTWTVEPYFMSLAKPVLRRFTVPGLDSAADVVVVHGKAYVLGKTDGEEALMEVSGTGAERLALPEGGSFHLGVDYDGAQAPILVGAGYVWRWQEERWESVPSGGSVFPNTFKPAIIGGGRLYIRDNGSGEDDKRLWILDLKAPKKLESFDDHVGVVGQMGPRWEFVWSCVPGKDGGVWIVTGSAVTSNSLLSWSPVEGYRIALYNDGLDYMDDFLWSPDVAEKGEVRPFNVTGLEPQADGKVLAVGARGLFSIDGKTITPLLRFKGTPEDWRPDTLLSLGTDRYFVACHWGGAFLLRKNAQGKWEAIDVDPS